MIKGCSYQNPIDLAQIQYFPKGLRRETRLLLGASIEGIGLNISKMVLIELIDNMTQN